MLCRPLLAQQRRTKMLKPFFGKGLTPQTLRITNDTIAERRKEVIAKGKKFKYPVQVSHKRIVIYTIIIALLVGVGFGVYTWHNLYRIQSTGDLSYNIARILPLQVANVDGQPVRYDAYLRSIRADIFYYINEERRAFNSQEGNNELNYHKRNDLRTVERQAYAAKLAQSLKLQVTDQEVNDAIKRYLNTDNSTEESLVNSLKKYYGWSLDEYRAVLKAQMLEQKVAFKIDDAARNKLQTIQDRLRKGEDFATLAKELSDDSDTKAAGGATAVLRGFKDPTGVVNAVQGKKEGDILPPMQIKTTDGYYYYVVRYDGIDRSGNEEQIKYSIIAVKLSKYNDDFNQLIKDNKIKEYIKVPTEQEIKDSK